MSVASHLHIRLDEYDARIRTFIPRYDEMVAAAAQAVCACGDAAPRVLDLGTGTGALASRILEGLPASRLTVVDEDEQILALARQRLRAPATAVTFAHGSFVDLVLPSCDVVVASLSLHHVRTAEAKGTLYRKCRAALRAGGLFVTADCCPSADPALAALERGAWRQHLERSYTPDETNAFFAAWAGEDVYFSLPDEIGMLRHAGFRPDVVWRSGSNAVLAGRAV